jgi:hypothetical protein
LQWPPRFRFPVPGIRPTLHCRCEELNLPQGRFPYGGEHSFSTASNAGIVGFGRRSAP